MEEIKYLEENGLRVSPIYEGSRPVGFSVVTQQTEEDVETFKTLYKAEDFVLRQRSPEKHYPTCESAAEVKAY